MKTTQKIAVVPLASLASFEVPLAAVGEPRLECGVAWTRDLRIPMTSWQIRSAMDNGHQSGRAAPTSNLSLHIQRMLPYLWFALALTRG